MKILHTADWHLGDRLGRIDRTDDLRRSVEQVGRYCDQYQVDVLIIAGDLFSEMSRPDSLRASIEHLQHVFEQFLLGGGTILAVTGNHDNENFCQTLHLVMSLAAPASSQAGDLCLAGRLYLATNPTFLRLADRQGQEVQFILMPYPTSTRYLRDEETQRYLSLEEKNRHLQAGFTRKLREIQDHPRFNPALQTVLVGHIHVQGAMLPRLFRINEQESIVFAESDLPANLAYVALGHIHQAHCLRGLPHVRYSGSIERLDLGEQQDDKGVVLLDLGPEGRRGEPQFLPLETTPFLDLDIFSPTEELPRLRERYPDAGRALVRYRLKYQAGTDNLQALLEELNDIFPRWYARELSEASDLGMPLTNPNTTPPQKSFHDLVRDYLKTELCNHPDAERDDILHLAEALLAEEES